MEQTRTGGRRPPARPASSATGVHAPSTPKQDQPSAARRSCSDIRRPTRKPHPAQRSIHAVPQARQPEPLRGQRCWTPGWAPGARVGSVTGASPRAWVTALRGVDLLGDLRRGQALVGRVVRHREVDLGGQDVGVTGAGGEDLAPCRLGGALAVDVGGGEEVDACLEGRLGAGAGRVRLDAAGVGEPGPERDSGSSSLRRGRTARRRGIACPGGDHTHGFGCGGEHG